MRPPRHMLLVDKAIEATVSAIEIYNKPRFHYREETFAILMLNAWEILLKARILKENNNQLRSIEIWESRKRKDGSQTKRMFPKKNRAKNNMTIGIQAASQIVRNYPKNSVDHVCIRNLVLLAEIRDNAVHFHQAQQGLKKRVQEIGSAAIRNFSYATKAWFGRDLAEFNFALMPFAFESPLGMIKTAFADDSSTAGANLAKLLDQSKNAIPFAPLKPFNIGVEIELKFLRKTGQDGLPVRIAPNDPDAVPVVLGDQEFRKRFKWSYKDLYSALRDRYEDFKVNEKFHQLRRPLEKDPNLCLIRKLDEKNPKSQKQFFYSPEIASKFDANYILKK